MQVTTSNLRHALLRPEGFFWALIQPRGRRPWGRGLLILVFITVAACNRTEEGSTPSLTPPSLTQPSSFTSAPVLTALPALDTTGMAEGVQRQLQQQQQLVERRQKIASSEPTELAQAFGDLGLLYVIYDLQEHADICFENALRLEPRDSRWPYLQGYLRGRSGRHDEAIKLHRQSLDLEPGFVPALLRLGRSAQTLGQTNEARTAFERVLALDPNVAAAHEGLGKVATDNGDDATAISHYQRALELDRDANSLHYALAVAHRNLGHLDQARSHLQHAGDIATRIVDPLINPLASLAESSQFYLVQGAEALDNGDYETAATAFRNAIDRDDDSFAAFRGLAISLERLGDSDGARATFEQALAEATTGNATQDVRERAGIERSLGLLAATQARDAEALAHYQASLALRADQPDLLLRSGNTLARARRFEEAIVAYDRLIELEPAWTPAVLEKRATALVNLRRWAEAVADFERAIKEAPGEAALRQRFADALELMGDTAAANEQRLAAQQHSSDDSTVTSSLTTAKRSVERGDFAAAVTLYRDVLTQDPDHLEAQFGLASVLGQLGQFDQAAEAFEQVIRQAPRHVEGRRGQIIALVLAQQYGQARVKLQEALRTFPRHAGFALTQVHLLATAPDARVRDGKLAFEIARRVYGGRQDPQVLEALALAAAATGDHAAASALQRELVTKVGQPSATNRQHIDLLRKRLAAFEAGEPWLATSPDEVLSPLLLSPQSPSRP